MESKDRPLEVSVQDAKQLLDRQPLEVQIIDVREPDEYAICHVGGARHVPMRQIPENLPTFPRDKHLLILCHHGGRSMRVTQFLRANGFSNVTNIAGGIDAWATQIETTMPRY